MQSHARWRYRSSGRPALSAMYVSPQCTRLIITGYRSIPCASRPAAEATPPPPNQGHTQPPPPPESTAPILRPPHTAPRPRTTRPRSQLHHSLTTTVRRSRTCLIGQIVPTHPFALHVSSVLEPTGQERNTRTHEEMERATKSPQHMVTVGKPRCDTEGPYGSRWKERRLS